MTRIKKIGLIYLILCFALVLFSCKDKDKDKDGENDDPITPTVQPIGLDIENPTTIFNVGDGFSIGDLTAKVHFSDGVIKDVTNDIEIDSTKFNGEKDGTYEIIVSYKESNYVAKSFYLAVVGTGQSSSGGGSDDPIVDYFGPGTYTIDSSIDLADYMSGSPIAENTKFATGYYIIKGTTAKRANASAYAIELGKEESSWIEFNVTGTATITITCASTGSTNTSSIALYDDESQLINNNEGITTVTNTTETVITYTVTTGLYRIVSPKNTAYSNRGVRVYSVIVTQG